MSKIEPPEDPRPQILVAEKGEIQWATYRLGRETSERR